MPRFKTSVQPPETLDCGVGFVHCHVDQLQKASCSRTRSTNMPSQAQNRFASFKSDQTGSSAAYSPAGPGVGFKSPSGHLGGLQVTFRSLDGRRYPYKAPPTNLQRHRESLPAARVLSKHRRPKLRTCCLLQGSRTSMSRGAGRHNESHIA